MDTGGGAPSRLSSLVTTQLQPANFEITPFRFRRSRYRSHADDPASNVIFLGAIAIIPRVPSAAYRRAGNFSVVELEQWPGASS